MDEFLKRMGELFECVLFTASLAKVRSANGFLHCKVFSIEFINKHDLTALPTAVENI